MKGVLAILGLVVCTTAFQYSIPQYGKLYGYQNQVHQDEDVMTGAHNRFYGPYNSQYHQKNYGPHYQGNNNQEYQGDDYQHSYDNQGSYNGLYSKYYKGMHKFFDQFQDYLKNQEHKDFALNEDFNERRQHIEEQYPSEHFEDKDTLFVRKQQHVFQILKFINNPVYDTKFQQIYKNFDLQKYAQYYEAEAYKTFTHYWKNQMFLPKGQIFSVFNDVHIQQVEVLFRLFYTAKDYETFFKTAVWARQHFNEAMFLYTYSVAIVHREDTLGLVLPPIYEIYPHYFFNSEVMHKAYQYKMGHFENKQSSENGVYTIRSNYSGWYMNLNPEQSLSYYLEDVGINAFYYYYNLYFPYWMNSKDYPISSNRGEIFYFAHHQLLARYYLERLSHGVGEIEYFNWELPFETGYYPSLTYPNGLAFSERPNFANLQEYFANYGQRWCFISKYGYGYTYVNTYEQRILEAIDLGYFYTHDGKKENLYTAEGFNVLGNIIEGNADSPNYRYYGSYVNFARHLLGYSKQHLDNYKLAPSALEHFETSLRDPAFYKLFKKITLLLQKYQSSLPAYTKKELYYPGVKVERVEVDPLVTFYDKFYSDITNGLTVTPEEYRTDSFRVQVEQYRLNHKNFNYKLYVNSDKTSYANVKVFIGPKYDEHGRTMDFFENRMNFLEVDRFVYDLKSGQNVIVRNSRDFTWTVTDKTSYFDMYKNIMTFNQINVQSFDDQMHGLSSYPLRYILPRGSEEGTTFQMYIIVYPYVQHQEEHINSQFHNKYNHQQTTNTKSNQFWKVMSDSSPLSYPFDRPAEFEHVYFVPNAYVKNVKIYHKVHHSEDFVNKHFVEEESRLLF